MLEVRNITKTYRAKSGVSVKALDRVSLAFPERGLIFLLGKSGSGKSTLLNVIGGLDTFDADGGEVVIKGKSSKDFRASDFDAYRNTFIGFIFQEYNILDEFSVGANIALALQLQGKRADEETVNAMLEQVDLAGFGHRKPNELSGGQKQRIAIARALIKNPEIIMADEPTGALDSKTGEQVFETLKKLSRDKLVIVVSHDRDFAERFGDRIIELCDGHVISDTTITRDGAGEAAGIRKVGDDLIRIRRGYTLTPEDVAMINAYLAKNDRDILLSKNEKLNGQVCSAAGISDEVGAVTEKPTGEVAVKQYDPAETKFIRSHLPFKNAFKIGVGGMKRRPVRLAVTILLSFIAFALFGLADTMASYQPRTTIADSLADSEMSALALDVRLRTENTWYNSQGEKEEESVDYYTGDTMSDTDIATLEEQTGLDFYAVYSGYADANTSLNLSGTVADSSALRNSIQKTLWEDCRFYGAVEMTRRDLDALGYKLLSGTCPTAQNEIAVTKYHFDMWKQGGMMLADGTVLPASDLTLQNILGKNISVSFGDGTTYVFTVSGVVDTGFSKEKYKPLAPDYTGGTIKENAAYTMMRQLEFEVHYGFHGLLFCAPGFLDTMPSVIRGNIGTYFPVRDGRALLLKSGENAQESTNCLDFNTVVSSDNPEEFEILWTEAGKTGMSERDFVIPMNALFYMTLDEIGLTRLSLFERLGFDFTEEELETILAGDAQGGDGLLNAVLDENYPGMRYFDFSKIAASLRYAKEHSEEIAAALSDPDHPLTQYVISRNGSTTVPEGRDPGSMRLFWAASCLMNCDNNGLGVNMDVLTREQAWKFLVEHSTSLPTIYLDLVLYHYNTESYTTVSGHTGMAVTGFFKTDAKGNGTEYVISDALYSLAKQYEREQYAGSSYSEQVRGKHNGGKYVFAIAPMPEKNSQAMRVLLDWHMNETDPYVYRMNNYVVDTVDDWSSLIETLRQVFLYVGIGFAVFAALMMLNFVSATVTDKKREIGILRAVGARASDVFHIFFSQAFVVAAINFLLAAVATFVATFNINLALRNELGFALTLLHFGVRQVLLILGVSVLVALIGTLLPAWKIAKKTPVDAMKDR